MKSLWLLVGLLSALFLLCESSNSPNDVYQRAYSAYIRQEFDESIKHFKQLLKITPPLLEIYSAYGTVLEAALKFKEARDLYKEAGWKFPQSLEPSRLTCRALYNEFQRDMDNVNLKAETEKVCERVVEKGGTAADHMMVGNFYLDTNRPRRALGELEQAVTLLPFEPGFTYRENLLRAYSIALLRNARCADSLELARELLAGKPDSKELTCNLGHILMICEPRSWEGYTFTKLCSTCNDQKTHCELSVPEPGKCGGDTKFRGCAGDWEACTSPNIHKLVVVPSDTSLIYGSNDTLTLKPLHHPLPLAYTNRQIYVVHFKDVFMATEAGRIFSDCHVFTTVHSFNAKLPQTLAHPKRTIEIDTPVISLISQTMENYYHFFAEGMSRFFLSKRYIKNWAEYKFLIPEGNRFISQFVELFGLENQVIRYQSSSEIRYHFKDVCYVDWYQKNRGEIHQIDGWAVYQPSLEGIHAVREGFLPLVTRPIPKKPEIVLVSRDDTAGLRAITNEEELVTRLRVEFPEYTINKFVATKIPLVDQIGTFSQAEVVLGPHGAGLTNVMFCRPGTPFLYFPVEPSVDSNFGHISSAVGIDFWVVPSASAPFFGQYTFEKNVLDDIVDTLRAALKRKASRAAEAAPDRSEL